MYDKISHIHYAPEASDLHEPQKNKLNFCLMKRCDFSGIKKKFEIAMLNNYSLPSNSFIYNSKNTFEASASVQRYSDL